MNFILDTNICVHYLRGMFSIDDKIKTVGFSNCYISEITLAELEFGVENSSKEYRDARRAGFNRFQSAFEKRVLPIRDGFSIYAINKARLRKQGLLISDFDLLIGCTALFHNMVIVTENIKEFERIDGIQIENWVVRN